MQPAKASNVFLDLDGTVTDPREGIVRSISHALTVMERPSLSDESSARFIGPPLAKTFESLLGTADQAVIRAAIDAHRERFAPVAIDKELVIRRRSEGTRRYLGLPALHDPGSSPTAAHDGWSVLV